MSPINTIYIIQSAHTDIGYTHPQEQIADMYLDHYRLVLDYCRRTQNAPVQQRFKWTCETFWQVENFLSNCPEYTDEFLGFVRSGQIEVTAAYLHFADLIDANSYRRSVQKAVDFCAKHQIPLRTAMHCDINGWPWAVADIFSELQIPYFCSQVHIDNATDPLGARGSAHYGWIVENLPIRKDCPIRVPQAFWWVGPNGGRVLHWLNEHYMLGNMIGVSGVQGFSADKTRYFYETDQMPADDLYTVAAREVPKYIDRLQAAGYSLPIMLLSTGGYYVDNARPDLRSCEVIARWNAEHDSVKMQTATLGEWFDALNQLGTDQLPVRQVAWPDHWAHGLGSSTSRIAQARRSARRRPNISALVERSESPKASQWLTRALNQELFAIEHTFDAWSTTAHPESSANDFQHAVKDLTYYRTELYLDEAAGTALRAIVPQGKMDRLYVFTPEKSAGTTRLIHFDANDQRVNVAKSVLVGADGSQYPIQIENPSLSQYTAAVSVSPGSLTSFTVIPATDTTNTVGSAHTLETDSWRIELDEATGGLTSLYQKQNRREWVQAGDYGFGQLVRETVIHPLGREAVGNLARFVALGMANEDAIKWLGSGPRLRHSQPQFDGKARVSHGPVFDSLHMQTEFGGFGRVAVEWRAYHALPMIELVLDCWKEWSELPEAAYVAFPFAAPDATLEFQTGGGFFVPGSHEAFGQLPGTCSSYYTIQHTASIKDAATGTDSLLWLPLDAPLVLTNQVKYDRWETNPYRWNGLLASMPINHYWHTNFPTSQRGYMRLRYRIMAAQAGNRDAWINSALPLDAAGWR